AGASESPGWRPPATPVVGGDGGWPCGSTLGAFPCHNEPCPCQPTVKLSPTQRLPSLSNIAPPPARYPPPSNLSGSTQALGETFRYGMDGAGRIGFPLGGGVNVLRQWETRQGRLPGDSR